MTPPWTFSPWQYHRRPTREVRVGDIGIGAANPIRIQSMTTPATTDTEATVTQIARLVEAGCEIVRVTVPTSADARNLPAIRRALAAQGVRVPLVADIHFSPGAALRAIEHVEKIRVNPGNYADRKSFAVREYTDTQYESELSRLEEAFRPLVLRARELGVAMRIGTNHGSLSDRIINRYGDSPLGMVESALEFVRICETHGYRDLVISMKSSNPVVTIQAYRLLAARMAAERMDYPFHLGVTEAGDGEDGRIKSAIGIGSLLEDGIGDTVRVSLTEDPVEEIPVAQRLVAPYNHFLDGPGMRLAPAKAGGAPAPEGAEAPPFDPYTHARRHSTMVSFGPCAAGGEQTVRVEVRLRSAVSDPEALRREIDAQAGPRVPQETRADLVECTAASREDLAALERLAVTMRLVAPGLALSVRPDPALGADLLDALRSAAQPIGSGIDRMVLPAAPLLAWPADRRANLLALPARAGCPILLEGSADEILALLSGWRSGPRDAALPGGSALAGSLALTLVPPPAGSSAARPVHAYRRLAAGLAAAGLDLPIVLSHLPGANGADPLLETATVLGSLLCDGIGDAVSVVWGDAASSRALAFNILQGARVRISKTEFISCPSCGRTLFDLEETTRRIKQRTAHLKGLKIAIMGCVVNGPGEMADADFGYVGWGAGKIALFVGKEIVARDIPTEEADDRLVALIKEHGKWQDPAPAPV